MRKYDSYKESGIEYVHEVPIDWEVKPLYTLFTEVKEKNKGNLEKNVLSLSYGNIKKRDVESNMGLLPDSFETYNRIKKDDIVLRLTDLQNDKKSLRTGLVKENGIITSAYVTLRKRSHLINAEYAQFLLHAYDVKKVFYNLGAGVRQSMGFSELKKMNLLLPSINEQNQIVKFLSKKITEIDELVTVLGIFINKLEQQRQSIITEGVTKGLNPNVKMKDSGVEWIGEIPEHWELNKIKYCVNLLAEKAEEKSELQYVGLENIESKTGRYILTEDVEIDGAAIKFFKGNVLFGKLRPYLTKTLLSEFDGRCSTEILVLQIISSIINNTYLKNLLLTPNFIGEINSSTYGSKMPRANWNFIGNTFIPLPPLSEQEAIVKEIKEVEERHFILVSKLNKQIEKLKEYRQSLIYEAVTGKIDVREMELD